MADMISLTDEAPELPVAEEPTHHAMVEIFDPPMCCPTGLCGPTLDQTLLDVNEMVLALRDAGIDVERYQMASHPQAFISNPKVMALVKERQMDALPITLIAGEILCAGAYPTLDEVRAALNEATEPNGATE